MPGHSAARSRCAMHPTGGGARRAPGCPRAPPAAHAHCASPPLISQAARAAALRQISPESRAGAVRLRAARREPGWGGGPESRARGGAPQPPAQRPAPHPPPRTRPGSAPAAAPGAAASGAAGPRPEVSAGPGPTAGLRAARRVRPGPCGASGRYGGGGRRRQRPAGPPHPHPSSSSSPSLRRERAHAPPPPPPARSHLRERAAPLHAPPSPPPRAIASMQLCTPFLTPPPPSPLSGAAPHNTPACPPTPFHVHVPPSLLLPSMHRLSAKAPPNLPVVQCCSFLPPFPPLSLSGH